MGLRSFFLPFGINHSPQKISKSDESTKNKDDQTEAKTYLAKGRFASGSDTKVYLCVTKCQPGDKELLVLKSFEKSIIKKKDKITYDIMMKEKEILQMLQGCEYFPKLRDCFATKYSYNIVTSYVKGGNLAHYLLEKTTDKFFDEIELRLCIAELLYALNYLHNNDILHLDIKLNNTLISATGHIVITDFDLSVMKKHLQSLQGCAGTHPYTAPEILQGKDHSFAADHWSLGIMIYIMINKVSPYTEEVVTYEMAHGEKFVFPTEPEGLNDILSLLLEKDHTERLGYDLSNFATIKSLTYFKVINWDEIENGSSPPPFPDVANRKEHKEDVEKNYKTFKKYKVKKCLL